jgi:hypothetical protein
MWGLVLDRAPGWVLRPEGVALFGASLALYLDADFSVLALILLFLLPDLAIPLWLVNPRVGAAAYNAVHTTLFPLVLGAAGVIGDSSTAVQVALIWLGHIGVDRMLGYGLKYPTQFQDTHLQRV